MGRRKEAPGFGATVTTLICISFIFDIVAGTGFAVAAFIVGIVACTLFELTKSPAAAPSTRSNRRGG